MVVGFSFHLSFFFGWQKKRERRNWIKVQTNAAIQYASPFLINKIYEEEKKFILYLIFTFCLRKRKENQREKVKYIKFHHPHPQSSYRIVTYIYIYIEMKRRRRVPIKRIERKFDCNSKRYNKFSQTVSFSPALCTDGHIRKIIAISFITFCEVIRINVAIVCFDCTPTAPATVSIKNFAFSFIVSALVRTLMKSLWFLHFSP